MSTIPAGELVAVTPGVLPAGGAGLDVIGLLLSTATRVPIGSVASFSDQASVADYFGPNSLEATLASNYFAGFDNSAKKPASMLAAQYNQNAVGAFLRGGDVSGLTLAQLQAIVGTLSVTVDGYPFASASVNLSAATSFSNAAASIQTSLNAVDPSEASVTASIGSVVTGSISVFTLTVTVAGAGLISIGDTVTGSGVTAGTKITGLGSGSGGTGTYAVNNSQTVGSESLTLTSNVLNVTAVGSGTVAVGQTVDSSGTDAVITALGTGTGAAGTYVISGSPQHVAAESMTTKGTPVVVTYDSVSGAFIVASGITGTPSTIAFATGTTAAGLALTSATGAVLSQGAAAAVPASFMNAVVAQTTNWVTFWTAFDPDNDSGNTVKLAFAAWVALQSDRYVYVCWDTDQSPVAANPAAASMGQILDGNGNSGTCLLGGVTADGWGDTTGPALAAFVSGAAGSIDFTESNGRISFAYKAQAGIAGNVTTAAAGGNLGGNPQSASRGNFYNFYGAYGSANQNDVWFQRGFVTGDFLWLDSFINQVWLNNAFQNALLTLLGSARSIPFDASGDASMESALADPIQAGLTFGAFRPGAISAAQQAEVNAQAGANIAGTIQTQGYYLQVVASSSTVRAARGPKSLKFWYLDRGSVQSINLSSVAVL